MKQRIEAPVFTWFLVGALLFSAFTFLLGIWVCSNAPRAGYEDREEVLTVMEHPEDSNMENVLQGEPDSMNQNSARDVESRTTAPATTETQKTAAVQAKKAKPKTTVTRKVVKKPEKKTATSQSEKTYYVQLTATTNRKAAEKMKQAYAGKGYNVYLVTDRKRRKTLYKVRIGVFKDWKKAKAIAEKIHREDKLKPWIIAI